MSAFHTGIHQRYVMKVDPAAASLRGQHTEQNTITEYMIFEFTAYTVTLPHAPTNSVLQPHFDQPCAPRIVNHAHNLQPRVYILEQHLPVPLRPLLSPKQRQHSQIHHPMRMLLRPRDNLLAAANRRYTRSLREHNIIDQDLGIVGAVLQRGNKRLEHCGRIGVVLVVEGVAEHVNACGVDGLGGEVVVLSEGDARAYFSGLRGGELLRGEVLHGEGQVGEVLEVC
jgi:hypothetical protein